MSIKVGLEYIGYIDPWTDEERLTDEEIVRCQDCMHWTEDEAEYYHYCGEWCGQVEPDGYCYLGKRSDE